MFPRAGIRRISYWNRHKLHRYGVCYFALPSLVPGAGGVDVITLNISARGGK